MVCDTCGHMLAVTFGRSLQHSEMSRSHNLSSLLEKLAKMLLHLGLEKRQRPTAQAIG